MYYTLFGATWAKPITTSQRPIHHRLGLGKFLFGGGERARVGDEAGGVIDRAEVDCADLNT